VKTSKRTNVTFWALTLFFSHSILASSLKVDANYRFGSSVFKNLQADMALPKVGSTSTYLEQRFLLKPSVVVDDRYFLNTEVLLGWNEGSTTGPQYPAWFGHVLGADGKAQLALRRAWFEWMSDYGNFRFGRMPKEWGLGILYNAGNNLYDDFGTTVDRASFKMLLGNLALELGYEKAQEANPHADSDDADVYDLALKYENPESQLNVGLLWTRTVVSAGAVGTVATPLAYPFPLLGSTHDLSLYVVKKWNSFQVAGEFSSRDVSGFGNEFGTLLQLDFESGDWNIGIDGAYASSNSPGQGYYFHPNYKPMLILFNQSLGADHSSTTANGVRSAVFGAYNAAGSAGALLTKLSIGYEFSKKYSMATELAWAQYARSAGSKSLGIESDIHIKANWSEWFTTQLSAGFLLPGDAINTSSSLIWGLRLVGGLNF